MFIIKQVSYKAVRLILNSKRNISKGFTLVELLVVMVVVGALVGAIMLVSNKALNKTRTEADLSTVVSLNAATTFYKSLKNLNVGEDIFDGFNNDVDRLKELLAKGYMSSIPVPSVSGSSFSWDVASQKWVIGGNITGAYDKFGKYQALQQY